MVVYWLAFEGENFRELAERKLAVVYWLKEKKTAEQIDQLLESSTACQLASLKVCIA